jgi:putative ABC transport system permease protein
MTQVLVAAALAALAVVLSRHAGLGLERELVVAALRAAVQLAAVGLVVALVFRYAGLSVAFLAVMLGAAAVTAGRRLGAIPRAPLLAGAAIAAGTAAGLVPLLATGAFSLAPRELIPVAGILIGGAMAATSLTGRRLTEAIPQALPAVEARLCLGLSVREALAPVVRQAVTTGLVPILDQTRSVGLVALPGTFVGLILGGASPTEAARVQLTVLLALLGVELIAALTIATLVGRAWVAPGARVVTPGRRSRHVEPAGTR